MPEHANFLVLMRHAQSEQAGINCRDFDRNLDEEGKEQAEKAGSLLELALKDLQVSIEQALVSPARRTVQTFNIMAAQLVYTPEAFFDKRVYNASRDIIKEVLCEYFLTCNKLIFIGHNPAVSDILYDLSGCVYDFKTAGVVILRGKENSLISSYNAGKGFDLEKII